MRTEEQPRQIKRQDCQRIIKERPPQAVCRHELIINGIDGFRKLRRRDLSRKV